MRKSISALIVLILSAVLLSSFGGDENTEYPGGSPGGYTGSPGDGKNCKQCHGGTVANVTGWITSNIPSQGYTAGLSYTITVTVTGTGSKGFEVSPQDPSGGLLGSLTPGSGTKLCNGNKAVTQTSGSSSNPKTWTFTWTAPAAGTGDVTFYGAFTVSKPVTKLEAVTYNEYAPAPLTVTATATPDQICEGSSSQLNAVATGGGGSYTYLWSSIPAGFISTLQNPVVLPLINTQYIVVVSDGANSASDTAAVYVTQPPASFPGNDTTCSVNVAEIQLHGQAGNYSSLLWSSSGDGSFSEPGMLNPVYFPGTGDKSTGWVNLYLTAFPIAPCSGSASSAMTVTFSPNVGTADQNTEPEELIVFPNPSAGNISILLPGRNGKECTVSVSDVSGKCILSGPVRLDEAGSVSVDLSGNPPGVYIVKLGMDGRALYRKVIRY